MIKRVIALALLAFVLAIPAIVALWFAFPVVIGFVTSAMMLIGQLPEKYKGRASKSVQIIAAVILVAAGSWAAFWPKAHPTARLYEASALNEHVAKLLPQPPNANLTASDASHVARRSFEDTINLYRRKLDLIKRARELYKVADLVHGRAVQSGLIEAKDLALVKEDLKNALEGLSGDTTTKGANLFLAGALDRYLGEARAAIDEIDAEGSNGALTIDALNDLSYEVPTRLGKYQIDRKFNAASGVQEALKRTLAAGISAKHTYEAEYRQPNNELVSRQTIVIDLDKSTVTDVDLADFISGVAQRADGSRSEVIRVRNGSEEFRTLSGQMSSISVTPGTKTITVFREVTKRNAARSLTVPELVPISLAEVVVDWPIGLRHSLTLLVQSEEDLSVRWPYPLTIDSAKQGSLQRVVFPKNSIYLTAPPIGAVASASGDELAPSQTVGELTALSKGGAIRVQMLPRPLQNKVGQDYKAYLVTENILAALAIWILSTLAGWLLFSKSS